MNAETSDSASQTAAEPSELDERIWSVVSFDHCEASALTYDEAVQKMQELDQKRITGLCIITDEAATRIPN
jgi:hypothetical protein